MEELKDIIKEIQGYKKSLNLNYSDDMILDCSTRIFISNNISNGKKFYSKSPIGSQNGASAMGGSNTSKDTLATPNQIAALKKHGYKGDVSKLTKREASQIIKEGKESKSDFPDY